MEQKRKSSQTAATNKNKETKKDTKANRKTERTQKNTNFANKAAVRNLNKHKMVKT
jgi:hypothetical protein